MSSLTAAQRFLFVDDDAKARAGFSQLVARAGAVADCVASVEVNRRIERAIRESDTAGRLGGDEFGVILEEVQTRRIACIVVERVLAAIREPIEIEGKPVRVGTSIGVALFPEAGEDGDALLRSADAAMYEAKRGAGNYRLVGGDTPGTPHPFRSTVTSGNAAGALPGKGRV